MIFKWLVNDTVFLKNKTDLYMQSYYLYNEKVKISNI